MFKNLKIFLSKNKKIINNNLSSKKFILIADRLRFDSCIRQSLISKFFNEKGYMPILATQKPNSIYHKVYKSFGCEKTFDTSMSSNKKFFFIHFFSFFFKTILIILKHSMTNFETFRSDLKIAGVRYGDQILDQYLRNHNYEKGIVTFKFFKMILISHFKINLIKKFIIKKKIKYTVVSTDSYINDSSVIWRVSENLKIKCIMSAKKTIKVYSLTREYNEQFHIIKNEDLEKIKPYSKVKRYLKKRFQGKIDHIDVKNAYSRKTRTLSRKDFLNFFRLNKTKFRKIILFAPHVFADSCGADGRFPFLNYYNFFTETYNRIKEIKDIFWIIRPHPGRYMWNEDNLIKNLMGKNKSKNIFLCPDKLSTKDLLDHVDTVVTGRGTIGIEAAIFGKKPLTCGHSIYSDIDFTNNAKTKKEFFKKLKFEDLSFTLSKKEIVKAEKALYFMGAYRWDNNSKIIPNIKTDKNIRKLNFYFALLNKNLMSKNFLEDDYYFDLKKKLDPYIN